MKLARTGAKIGNKDRNIINNALFIPYPAPPSQFSQLLRRFFSSIVPNQTHCLLIGDEFPHSVTAKQQKNVVFFNFSLVYVWKGGDGEAGEVFFREKDAVGFVALYSADLAPGGFNSFSF